jgi:hypothetical protein
MAEQNCEYIQKTYGVPACIGRRVIADGKPGVIAEDRGNYIGILLDCDKPGHVDNYHPMYKIKYLDEMGKVRKPGKAQARYRRFLEYGDMFDSFLDFCYWDADPDKEWNRRY